MNNSSRASVEFNFLAGSSYMISSEAIYFLSGYLVHIVAANNVSPLDYGRFGIVMSLMGIIYVLLSSGLPQSLTKHIAEGFDAKQTYFKVLRYQLIISLVLFALLFSSSTHISTLLGDKDLEVYIKAVSFLIPLRSIFHINRGFLNGLSNFGYSSIMSVVNNIGKSLLAIIFLLMGYGVLSMIGSYIVATFLAMVLSFKYIYNTGMPTGKKTKSSNLLFFSVPLIIFTICYTIIDCIDIFFIKAMIADSNATGYYNGAKVISSTIMAIGFAISYTTLPYVSKINSNQNHYEMQNFIGNVMRYLFLILCPITICISLTSAELIALFFPIDYVIASDSLKVLTISTSFFAIFVVQASIITGLGNPKLPMITSLFLIPIFIILNVQLIPKYGMVGSPISSLICTITGTVILSSFLIRRYQKLLLLKNMKFMIAMNIILFLFIYNISSLFTIHDFALVILYLFSTALYIYFWYLIEFRNNNRFSLI